MGPIDSFTLAVLAGAVVVVVTFGLLLVLDKGTPAVPPDAVPAKVAGKRR